MRGKFRRRIVPLRPFFDYILGRFFCACVYMHFRPCTPKPFGHASSHNTEADKACITILYLHNSSRSVCALEKPLLRMPQTVFCKLPPADVPATKRTVRLFFELHSDFTKFSDLLEPQKGKLCYRYGICRGPITNRLDYRLNDKYN